MAEINELSDGEKEFIRPYLPTTFSATTDQNSLNGHHSSGNDTAALPYVTLTYACSLDSMISLAPGVRTTLSGPETKSMTHYLRLFHDAILVGVGTATADNPSLNCRYPGVTLDSQPRPVVVDPKARWDVSNAKARLLAIESKGKLPWIIQCAVESIENTSSTSGYERLPVGKDGLQTTQKDLPGSSRTIEWRSILKALKQKGVESVMIEGGATVINELLSQPDLVDAVIVTIAPTWLGQGGVTVSPPPKTENGQKTNAAHLERTAWRQFGWDVVLCGKLKR